MAAKSACTTTEDADSLELSTILHQHASVQPSLSATQHNAVPQLPLPASVASTLDKLQALLATSTTMEGKYYAVYTVQRLVLARVASGQNYDCLTIVNIL